MARTGRPPLSKDGVEQFSVRLPRQLHRELKEMAEVVEESLSGLIVRVLGEWFEGQPKRDQIRAILEARQEAAKK
jgi:predicted HicB family RNase H-like nuclease